MKPPFPKVHSCTVHHAIETFCRLTMDCGSDLAHAAVVFDPTEEGSPQERQPITCPDCRVAAKQIQHEAGATVYEYGLVDIRALREWEKTRGKEVGQGDAA